MYRLGCDRHVYMRRPYTEWERLGENTKASWISASNDALWIVDADKKMPFKYHEQMNEFQQKGNLLTPHRVYAGVKGQALMRGLHYNRLYGWVEAKKEWKSLGGSTVMNAASGQKGRLYKVDLIR